MSPAQGRLNPRLLHCRQILYHWAIGEAKIKDRELTKHWWQTTCLHLLTCLMGKATGNRCVPHKPSVDRKWLPTSDHNTQKRGLPRGAAKCKRSSWRWHLFLNLPKASYELDNSHEARWSWALLNGSGQLLWLQDRKTWRNCASSRVPLQTVRIRRGDSLSFAAWISWGKDTKVVRGEISQPLSKIILLSLKVSKW